MPPRWIHRTCVIALLIGLTLSVLGPVFVYQIAVVTAQDPDGLGGAEVQQQVLQASLDLWRNRFLWIMPVGVGLSFFGVIGLLFLWVTNLANQEPG